jgi:hypothetical protein
MSINNIIIQDTPNETNETNIYLTTIQTIKLFNLTTKKILVSGNDTNNNTYNDIGSGYAILKNGKIPSNFTETYNLLKDFRYYDSNINLPQVSAVCPSCSEVIPIHSKYCPDCYDNYLKYKLNVSEIENINYKDPPSIIKPIKIRDDIFNLLLKGESSNLYILPFRNLILNMNVQNIDVNYRNYVLSPGVENNYMYLTDDKNINIDKFNAYLTSVKDQNNLSKILVYTNYTKQDDQLTISDINNFVNVEDLSTKSIDKIYKNISLIGGENNNFYHKYMKYKQKYLMLKNQL